MSNPSGCVYEFGPFRVDAAQRLLLNGGRAVSLTPKVFDTLLFFVENSERALSKGEMMEALWPDSFVEEASLAKNVSLLRRLLGSDERDHEYIETLPKFGYRFAAGVREVGSTGARGRTESTSVVVLPFANVGANRENDYFCDGLAEELINTLSKVRRLRVVARTSAFSFKGKDLDVREIGRTLNVSTVVEGSVRRSGDRVRIGVQVVNAANGYQLWAGRFDRELYDIFDMQDEIALAVADALRVTLLGDEKTAVLKRHTDDPDAYLMYLQGLYYRWKSAPADFHRSREYFEKAVDADPSFALGYFGLNSYYGYGSAWGLLPPNEGWPKAYAALTKALEIDDTLPEAHLSLAAFLLVNHRDWAAAEREIARVLEASPRFAEIHYVRSFYMTMFGRHDEAIAEARLALDCDPLSSTYAQALGLAYFYARRYDEAVERFAAAQELEPNNVKATEHLGDAYERAGAAVEAIAAWRRAATLADDDEVADILGRHSAADGFDAAVRAVATVRLVRLERKARQGEYVPAMSFARLYVRLGEREQAFRWLEKAAVERNAFALLLDVDPLYDDLRGDVRFADVTRSVGLSPARA